LPLRNAKEEEPYREAEQGTSWEVEAALALAFASEVAFWVTGVGDAPR
jgi:hypothetical protein